MDMSISKNDYLINLDNLKKPRILVVHVSFLLIMVSILVNSTIIWLHFIIMDIQIIEK
jgi:hypothetical protein